MFAISTAAPRPVYDSMPLPTAPSPDAVAAETNSAELAMPNRCSLPSMLPPGEPAITCVLRPAWCWAGEPCASAAYIAPVPPRKITSITAYSAQPWRGRPIMRPKVTVKAAGTSSISSSSMKLVSPVGFSNGCAELVLKKPPPSPDSTLIASCDATGPTAISWPMPVRPCAPT
jgi:hypothetical protein